MRRIDHNDITLSDTARAHIADIEHRFDCRIELRQGACGVGGALLPEDAGEVVPDIPGEGGLVPDSDRPAITLWKGPVGIERVTVHTDVFLARLRFNNGTATPSMCPAPTPDACVEFLVSMSTQPETSEAWMSQGAC